MRLIQGIGVGGEWGGSVLLAMEWARTNKNRGFIASWPQFGVPAGLFLANITVLIFSQISGEVPGLGLADPIPDEHRHGRLGLWIRLGILETPVFQRALAEEQGRTAPILEVIKRQPKEIILSALLRLASSPPCYIFNAFVFTYGTTVLRSRATCCCPG